MSSLSNKTERVNAIDIILRGGNLWNALRETLQKLKIFPSQNANINWKNGLVCIKCKHVLSREWRCSYYHFMFPPCTYIAVPFYLRLIPNENADSSDGTKVEFPSEWATNKILPTITFLCCNVLRLGNLLLGFNMFYQENSVITVMII